MASIKKILFFLLIPIGGYLVYWSDGRLQTFQGAHPYENELSFESFSMPSLFTTSEDENNTKGKDKSKSPEKKISKVPQPMNTSLRTTPIQIAFDIVDGKPKLLLGIYHHRNSYRNKTLHINLIKNNKIFKSFKKKFSSTKKYLTQMEFELSHKIVSEHFFVEAYFKNNLESYSVFRRSFRPVQFLKVDQPLLIDGQLNDWQGKLKLKEPNLLLDLDVDKMFPDRNIYKPYLSNLLGFDAPKKCDKQKKSSRGFMKKPNIRFSNEDFKPSFNIAYDKKYCYFSCHITDSEISIDSAKPMKNEQLFSDGVTLMFDMHVAEDFHLPHYDNDDALFIIYPSTNPNSTQTYFKALRLRKGKSERIEDQFKNSIFKSKLTQNGYIIECALLWSELDPEFKAFEAQTIGFNFEVHDRDSETTKYWSYNSLIRDRGAHLYPKLFSIATFDN